MINAAFGLHFCILKKIKKGVKQPLISVDIINVREKETNFRKKIKIFSKRG